ncbi:PilN domain-containing protein [Desulfolithobacter sp.]
MVYINLLPVREIKQRIRAKRQLVAIGISFFIFLVILGVAGYMQATKVERLGKEISALKKEKQRYDKINRQIKQLEKDRQVIEKQIAIIRQLKKNSSLTVHILDEIANITPTDRMWLTSLSQTGNSLQIAGMALDNRTIAKYMEDLKKSPYIKSVNLVSSSLRAYAGRNLKSFSLSCSVGVPEKVKEKNPAEKN